MAKPFFLPISAIDGLFVHVHKAAGSTIKEVLFRKLRLKNIATLVGLHKGKTDWNAVTRDQIPDKDFHRAFKFCFVRNPWDRVVSAYVHNKCKWKEEYDITFAEFVFDVLLNESIVWDAHWLIRNPAADRHEVAMWAGKGHSVPYGHPGYFMADMDFIGRFEQFDADFHHIMQRLGHPWDGKRIPRRNVSQRTAYQTYYTPQLRDAVGDLYHDDIVKFNYEFEAC